MYMLLTKGWSQAIGHGKEDTDSYVVAIDMTIVLCVLHARNAIRPLNPS